MCRQILLFLSPFPPEPPPPILWKRLHWEILRPNIPTRWWRLWLARQLASRRVSERLVSSPQPVFSLLCECGACVTPGLGPRRARLGAACSVLIVEETVASVPRSPRRRSKFLQNAINAERRDIKSHICHCRHRSGAWLPSWLEDTLVRLCSSSACGRQEPACQKTHLRLFHLGRGEQAHGVCACYKSPHSRSRSSSSQVVSRSIMRAHALPLMLLAARIDVDAFRARYEL